MRAGGGTRGGVGRSRGAAARARAPGAPSARKVSARPARPAPPRARREPAHRGRRAGGRRRRTAGRAAHCLRARAARQGCRAAHARRSRGDAARLSAAGRPRFVCPRPASGRPASPAPAEEPAVGGLPGAEEPPPADRIAASDRSVSPRPRRAALPRLRREWADRPPAVRTGVGRNFGAAYFSLIAFIPGQSVPTVPPPGS
ncbi:PREDICTED: translation initiation factor IF-2-like [Chinchilla lanigera]|uniref:translation initiation factor IF-2-like n=1 Tax=Chinchilla lanigera TaxID=34839 RepID=UPI0006987F37|nr:PREDICTED: translation initiation factor IF-2-like [Chinchilla lanigera]